MIFTVYLQIMKKIGGSVQQEQTPWNPFATEKLKKVSLLVNRSLVMEII